MVEEGKLDSLTHRALVKRILGRDRDETTFLAERLRSNEKARYSYVVRPINVFRFPRPELYRSGRGITNIMETQHVYNGKYEN